MSKKTIIWGIVGVVIVAFGWYTISPIFRNIEVDDTLPENIMNDSSGGDEVVATNEDDGVQQDMVGEVEIERFPVMGTLGHRASGFVRIIETESGTVIRYEDFETINGPNLHVYLAKDLDAKEYIDLGEIKGTRGNINYEVPDGIDISQYKYVMYWCVPFSVLFNYAEIN